MTSHAPGDVVEPGAVSAVEKQAVHAALGGVGVQDHLDMQQTIHDMINTSV